MISALKPTARDACSKEAGGAASAGWEALFGMEALDLKGGHHSKGATTLVVGLANALEKGATHGGLAMGYVLRFPAENTRKRAY